jgi:hypothetical protein
VSAGRGWQLVRAWWRPYGGGLILERRSSISRMVSPTRMGEVMGPKTKDQLKLAFWGGVAVVILLSAIYAVFE